MRLLALPALLVSAWFVLGVVQASSTSAARDELGRPPWPEGARAARVEELLDRAGVLNPDAGVDRLRARLAGQQGDRGRAQRILERLVREHPEDIEAWALLGIVTLDRDPEAHARARAALRRLAPPVD